MYTVLKMKGTNARICKKIIASWMLSGFEEYLQGKTIQQAIIFKKKLCQETLKNVSCGSKDVT